MFFLLNCNYSNHYSKTIYNYVTLILKLLLQLQNYFKMIQHFNYLKTIFIIQEIKATLYKRH